MDFQAAAYPRGFNKLRYLENHDIPRIAAGAKAAGLSLEALTALMFFLPGATLLYAGQEVAAEHLPSLFDRDTVAWNTGKDLSGLLARLAAMKHKVLGVDDSLQTQVADGCMVVAERSGGAGRWLGVFPLAGGAFEAAVDAPDGSYENLVDGTEVAVQSGMLRGERPAIIGLPA